MFEIGEDPLVFNPLTSTIELKTRKRLAQVELTILERIVSLEERLEKLENRKKRQRKIINKDEITP